MNNAGRSQRAEFQRVQVDVDRALFELNVFGPVALARTVLPHFIERGSGQVVVTSSVMGKFAAPYSCSYAASKHALHVRNIMLYILFLLILPFMLSNMYDIGLINLRDILRR